MRQLKGSHKCFVCNESFFWVVYIKEKNGEELNFNAEEAAVGELIADGRIITSNGNKVLGEVYVNCPYCGNKNKIERQQA